MMEMDTLPTESIDAIWAFLSIREWFTTSAVHTRWNWRSVRYEINAQFTTLHAKDFERLITRYTPFSFVCIMRHIKNFLLYPFVALDDVSKYELSELLRNAWRFRALDNFLAHAEYVRMKAAAQLVFVFRGVIERFSLDVSVYASMPLVDLNQVAFLDSSSKCALFKIWDAQPHLHVNPPGLVKHLPLITLQPGSYFGWRVVYYQDGRRYHRHLMECLTEFEALNEAAHIIPPSQLEFFRIRFGNALCDFDY